MHVDNAYEEYIRGTDILAGNQVSTSRNFPYSDGPPPRHKNEGGGPTLSPPYAWGLIGAVRIEAERAAFAQKWLVARRARLAVMGALIDLILQGNTGLTGLNRVPNVFGRPEIINLLNRVRDENIKQQAKVEPAALPAENNHLLSQMFPEGSPAHPAWPSDHATIAGACVTAIKAIFDDCATWITPEKEHVVVGHELDKLASNIAFARGFAGVHYRTDGEHGIRLGEEIAIRYLEDQARTYREQFRECRAYTLTKRNGTRICITPDGIEEIEPCPVMLLKGEELHLFIQERRQEQSDIYPVENL